MLRHFRYSISFCSSCQSNEINQRQVSDSKQVFCLLGMANTLFFQYKETGRKCKQNHLLMGWHESTRLILFFYENSVVLPGQSDSFVYRIVHVFPSFPRIWFSFLIHWQVSTCQSANTHLFHNRWDTCLPSQRFSVPTYRPLENEMIFGLHEGAS